MSKTANKDPMSPDASPGDTSKKSGIRRVNNWPLILILAGGGAFLLIMLLVANDRAAQQNQPGKAAVEKGGNSSMYALEIAGGQMDGMVPDGTVKPLAVPAEPAPTLAPSAPAGVTIVRPDNLEAPPTPPGSHGEGSTRENDDQIRIRQVKLQQFEEAVRAKTTVRTDMPRSAGSSGVDTSAPTSQADALARISAARQEIQSRASGDPTAAYQARLAQLRGQSPGASGGGFGGSGAGSSDSPFLVQNNSKKGNNAYDQFSNQQEGDRWDLKAKMDVPQSPYQLRAGYVIPATLISGINSELPGQIIAQVSQDVSNTSNGKHLLIPQGSRLIGQYSADVGYGQSRILVGWQRIIFPDGKAMDIGSMPGADSAGYAGFTDLTNNHLFRLFGSAALMSGITAGISLSQDSGQSSGVGQQATASSALSEAVGQQLGQATAALINKNMNVAPTLEIRPGYRFNVMVTKDMTFSKPYKSFDY